MSGKVTILDRGKLSPSQILAAVLNDPDFAQIETVVVLTKTHDGVYYASWSDCRPSDRVLLAAVLTDQAVKAVRDEG